MLRGGPLALGGAPLGNLFGAVTDETAEHVVGRALASGVRCFDTAPHYGSGLSERRFGTALRDVPRDRYLLSTKVGRLLIADPDAPRHQHGYVDVAPFVQRYDYSYDGTLRSLDESLHRLGLSRIDIAYVHDIDIATHGSLQPQRFREAMDGAVRALERRKHDGALAGFGIGVNDVQICIETLAVTDIDVILIAGRYTLADQSALPKLLPECVRRGVSIVAGGVFNSGILATGTNTRDGTPAYFNYAPAPVEIVRKVQAIESVCRAFDVPLHAAALQFPLAHPAVASIVVGARTVSELDANVRGVGHPIPALFWDALRTRGLIDSLAPVPSEGASVSR